MACAGIHLSARGLLPIIGISVISALLTACSETYVGSDPVLGPKGFIISSNKDGATDFNGEYGSFRDAEAAAYVSQEDTTLAKRMAVTGFALVYANCDRYFRSAGQTQQHLILARDALAALGSLATGVLALTHASRGATAIAGLVTVAGYTGIDTITKDYLFSADNVDQVRTLILNALSAHQSLTMNSNPTLTYHSATKAILDNQDICTLRAIAALAKDAIKNGQIVKTNSTPEGDLQQLASIGDAAIRQRLKQIIGGAGPITDDELIALYWYVASTQRPDGTDLAKFIGPKLSPNPGSPVDVSGKALSNSRFDQTRTQQLLSQLSPAAQTDIVAKIKAIHAQYAAPSGAPSAAAAVERPFAILNRPIPVAPRVEAVGIAPVYNRITVGIRQPQ